MALGNPSALQALKNIAPPLPLDKMQVIFQAFFDDEWYDHIVQWRLAPRRRKEVIGNPWDFYFPPEPTARAPMETPPAPAMEAA